MANPVFRSKANGKRYTVQLFFDLVRDLPIEKRTGEGPYYTLHHDHEGMINFRKEYLKDEDSTGYTTAVRLLESYDHWQLLMKAQWFREAKELWDEELNAKLEARAHRALIRIMEDDDAKRSEQLAAAKAVLAEEAKRNPRKKKQAPSRGRPTNDEVEGKLNQRAQEVIDLEEDAKRIKLVHKD